MHELGVAFHVIDQVIEIAHDNNVPHVTGVTLEVGEVSTIVPEYFEDVWNWAVSKHPETLNCRLHIEIIKAVTHCEDCGTDYPTVEYAKICPNCGSEHTYLVTGNDLILKEIEIEEESSV